MNNRAGSGLGHPRCCLQHLVLLCAETERSELYYLRTEILGNSLCLQSGLAKLHRHVKMRERERERERESFQSQAAGLYTSSTQDRQID